MPINRKRLSHQQYFELVQYMKTQAVHGKISLKPGEFAREVAKVNGFYVCPKTITRAAKDNDIEMLFNNSSSNGEAPDDMDADQKMLSDQLFLLHAIGNRIESKLDAIMKDFSIAWTRSDK